MISEQWIGKDVEGSGRGLMQGIIPAIALNGWEKPRKPAVMVAGLQADIWTQDLPNTKQES
jgi:hypothetical protein